MPDVTSHFLPENVFNASFHDLLKEMDEMDAAYASLLPRKSDGAPAGLMFVTNDPVLAALIEELLINYDDEGEEE